MFRRLFACCLRQRSEADESSFEDFVDEDLIGKPQNMTDARWRARFDEDELVLVAAQAEKQTPPPPPSFDDVYGEVVGKVNDAWVISTTALVHDPPAAVAEEEEEDIPPTPSRWRVCRRHWAEKMAAKPTKRPQGGRGFRPGRR